MLPGGGLKLRSYAPRNGAYRGHPGCSPEGQAFIVFLGVGWEGKDGGCPIWCTPIHPALQRFGDKSSSARLSSSTFTRGSPSNPRSRWRVCFCTKSLTADSESLRTRATRGI